MPFLFLSFLKQWGEVSFVTHRGGKASKSGVRQMMQSKSWKGGQTVIMADEAFLARTTPEEFPCLIEIMIQFHAFAKLFIVCENICILYYFFLEKLCDGFSYFNFPKKRSRKREEEEGEKGD